VTVIFFYPVTCTSRSAHVNILGRVSVAGNRHLIPTDPAPAVSYQ